MANALDSECHWLYNTPAGELEIGGAAGEVIFRGHFFPLYSYYQLHTWCLSHYFLPTALLVPIMLLVIK